MQYSTANSRKMIVRLAICSMNELYNLAKTTLKSTVSAETLIVRIGMMEFLAKEVIIHLLKINYLDEKKEYVPIAELLDDVYIVLKKCNIKDDTKYTAMYDALGMVDERLKTIRVVYQSVSKNPKSLTLIDEYDPVKFEEVRRFILSNIWAFNKIHNHQTPMNVDILKRKLAIVREVFEYIVENIVFICTNKVFRKQGPNSPNGLSFMQTAIQRCKTLTEETRYYCLQFILKHNTKNIQQDLSNNMKKTINILEHAQVMLCYYYRNYVWEPEPLAAFA